jgi:putative hydrolase of HD superfamily
MEPERATAILGFLAVADRLKTVARRGRVVLPDGATRREDSVEHCWSLALIGVLLHGDVSAPLDLGRALAMVAVHDLVEIEAGDTFAWDAAACATQAARGAAAAEAVFGLLPADLGTRLRALWEEFEAGAMPEARFAAACDRMQGFLQNVPSGGQAWKAHGVTRAGTLPRMMPAMDADPAFAALIGRLHDRAEEMRLLGPHP